MSDATTPASWEELPEAEKNSALFANLVMQQTNAALMLLGEAPHPQTGKTEVDLEVARLFIDLLEMLAVKTRGNLGKQEEAMLKQSLMMLRMAFVEKANASAAPKPAESKPAEPAPAAAAPTVPVTETTTPTEPEDSKKKFSKKY